MLYDKKNFKILHQGLDTLVLGVRSWDARLLTGTYSNLLSELKKLKESAKNIKTFGDKFVSSDLGLGFGKFLVSSRSNSGYIATIKNDDVSINFASASIESMRYHMRIEFRSKFLLQFGHLRAYEYVNKLINRIFGEKVDICVLRFDLCCDVGGIEFTQDDFLRFQTLKRIGHYSDITDFLIDSDEDKQISKLNQLDGGNFGRFMVTDGFSFGKSPFMFRIYNKIKQISKKQISTLIILKWRQAGFDPELHKNVFRFESEIHRPIFRKFLKNIVFDVKNEYKDEVDFLFKNLAFFWRYSLSFVKWWDLNDEELKNVLEIKSSHHLNRLYKKCEFDSNRFHLWDKIQAFNEQKINTLQRFELISHVDITKAKNALKAFVSAVYSNVGYDIDAFYKVFKETQQDLKKADLDLHDYGLIKLCGKFADTDEKIKNNLDDEKNPYKIALYENLDSIFYLFGALYNNKEKNKDYFYKVKSALKKLDLDRYVINF